MFRIQLIIAVFSAGYFLHDLSFIFSLFSSKINTIPACSCHHAISFKWGFKDLFLGKNESPSTTVARLELRNNNNNNNSSHSSLNYCFCRGKNAIAKKQYSFPVLIHHKEMKLAGARGLGTGEMAGKIHSQSFTISAGTLLPLIFISFYTWSHMVALCFEAIRIEWRKQTSRSIKSHLGVFKQNIQDKLKVLIRFRAVSHVARLAVGEIVSAVLTAFALAWSVGEGLPFLLLGMVAVLCSSWHRAAFLPWDRRYPWQPAIWSG